MENTKNITHKLIYSCYRDMLAGFITPDKIKEYIQKQTNDIHSLSNYKIIEYNQTTFKLYPIDIKAIKTYLLQGFFDLRIGKIKLPIANIRRIETTYYNQLQKHKELYIFDIYIKNVYQESISKEFNPFDIDSIAKIIAYENALKTNYARKKRLSILDLNIILAGPIRSYTEYTY